MKSLEHVAAAVIIILLSVNEVLLRETSLVLAPSKNHDSQQVLKLQNILKADEKREIAEKQTEGALKNTEIEVLGTDGNAGETGLTLEKCFGGLGRWLSLSSDRKKSRCCRCCIVRQKEERSGAPVMIVVEPKESCSHVKTEDFEKCSKICSEGDRKNVEGAKDTKLSLLRSVNTETESRRGLAVEPIPGVSTVKEHGRKGFNKRKSAVRRTRKAVSKGGNDCCNGGFCCQCARCCDCCCTFALGVPLWLISKCLSCCGYLILAAGTCCWCCGRY